ncbi:hypothetical protein R3P38DRAFT_3219562 [Favolaschia claudopus]|uniref:Uncharacterized protein n=1 Tax=Favolaschia claudopus TaxID=2862362 RepID=A0AAW0A287_9AGAR
MGRKMHTYKRLCAAVSISSAKLTATLPATPHTTKLNLNGTPTAKHCRFNTPHSPSLPFASQDHSNSSYSRSNASIPALPFATPCFHQPFHFPFPSSPSPRSPISPLAALRSVLVDINDLPTYTHILYSRYHADFSSSSYPPPPPSPPILGRVYPDCQTGEHKARLMWCREGQTDLCKLYWEFDLLNVEGEGFHAERMEGWGGGWAITFGSECARSARDCEDQDWRVGGGKGRFLGDL